MVVRVSVMTRIPRTYVLDESEVGVYHCINRCVRRDGWLSPVELARDERSERKPVRSRRASNKGCLTMSLADYLRLLDWTGRQLRRDKRGAIPADVSGILECLQISEAGWIDFVHDFGRLFRRAAGRPASLACEAQRCSRRWLQGISHSRNLFAWPSQPAPQ